jgi:hypothetical protein
MHSRIIRVAHNAYNFRFFSIAHEKKSTIWVSWTGHKARPTPMPIKKEAIMNRDELNRELRMHSATFPAVLIVYGLIVASLVFSAMAIL